jgi:hypothetical protein
MKKPAEPSEHPTLVPMYDVEKAARATISVPPETARAPEGASYRDAMPTYSDPVELEAARVKSSFTTPPPAIPVPPGAELSHEERLAVYELRLGGFDRVPVVGVSPEELASRSMDGRASMLLALLDGRSSVRTILDIGIMNPLDTLAGLTELLDRGVIGFRDPR